ncbi:MAG: hypothetical protein IMZ62_02425 [Chloroflexi bacterium]|nr:hypothetical protein [Chloroflexota bacterium]
MAIRIILEFDTPEEAAQLIIQLPGLARALPSGVARANLEQRAHERVDRAVRYEAYMQNGGRNNFLGWAHQGEPSNPEDAIDMIPSDQILPGALAVISKTVKN